MKKLLALFLAVFTLFNILILPTSAATFDPSPIYDVRASSVYIVNTDTNIILYEKNSFKQVNAGGLTKLMTAALLLSKYSDSLDTTTFTLPKAISDYVYGTDNADMRIGETFTLREALYAMLLRNANEAAMSMAYQLSDGDLAGWVSQMNSLSEQIGTSNSTWTDACGLKSGNTTCAVDIYLILRYLMSFDAFVEISHTATFRMPAKSRHSSPSILINQNVAVNKSSGGKFYRSEMQGGMCDIVAYKKDHGTQSYVSWATKNGETYIFCVMESPDTCDDFGYSNRRPALYETVHLIDWVFSQFSIRPALDPDCPIRDVPIRYSTETDILPLHPDTALNTILPKTADGSVTQNFFDVPAVVDAPVQQGDIIGTVKLQLAGETIGIVNLIAAKDVNRNLVLYLLSIVKERLGLLYLKVFLFLCTLTALIYGVGLSLRSLRQRQIRHASHRRSKRTKRFHH